MTDDAPVDKRRRQNRDSQRRFRERNKKRHSWSISSANQAGPSMTSSGPFLSGSNSELSGHATTYIPSEGWSLLSPEATPQATNEWTSGRGISMAADRGDVLYRQTQQYNGLSPALQISLPPFNTQFSLDETSMPNTNRDINYHQQQDFGHNMQVSATSKDIVLSPVSLLDTDICINNEPSRATQTTEIRHRHRSASMSRAEQMISDVENLYEFGVNLSLFPEDPSLCKSLRIMKERFRSLVKNEVSGGKKSEIYQMHESSSQYSDSDE